MVNLPSGPDQPRSRGFQDEIMDKLYVYQGTSTQPIVSVIKDAEGALYVVPHRSADAKTVEAVVFGAEKPEMAEIIAACRQAGYEATQTLRAPLEQREATSSERREARFIHESNLIEGVAERSYDEILSDLTKPKEVGHTEAWKLARQLANDHTPLTVESVLEMHRLLTKEQVQLGHPIDEQHIGRIRDVLVTIADVLKPIPIPSEQDLRDLIDTINREMGDIRDNDVEVILCLTALQHLRFEIMHPFADGNGRIGRILVNYVLAYFQYPPLVITNHDKQNYYKSFPEHFGKQGDMGEFFLKKYKES